MIYDVIHTNDNSKTNMEYLAPTGQQLLRRLKRRKERLWLLAKWFKKYLEYANQIINYNFCPRNELKKFCLLVFV